VLAVIPVRSGVLPAGGAEAASECGDRSLLIGDGVEAAASHLSGEVTLCEVGDFRPAAWAAALAELVADEPVIVLASSPDGRDLAPRLAAALDRPLLAGAVRIDRERVVLARGGGLSMHTVHAPAEFVATLQVGVRGADPVTVPATVSVRRLELSERADARVVRTIEPDTATIDLAEARRIVGGGAGLSGPAQFELLAAAGASVGASVGATRVITDRGWVGHERQIGTTGVVVAPELYLAFGISGAVQHTSGLGHPDHIVSVNTDAHCPMMQLADLAVVSDANEVLAHLVELLSDPVTTVATVTTDRSDHG
jgi:electron transfer flavoprotein alpha subunit